ncbi:MAG TPA: DNA internalization-related competence protein ComEC/Rec2, partial [Burkholderiaceae bacterium]|nr:DNA internalization-related competence protein ComEC/Rec2 [Burkholderiaceae bacterium]
MGHLPAMTGGTAARGMSGAGLRLGGMMLAWLAGVAVQLQQAQLWPAQRYGLFVAAGFVLMVSAGWSRRTTLPMLLAAALLGTGVAGLRAVDRLADALAPELEGQDLIVTGIVARLPQVGPDGTRFPFQVESAEWKGRPVKLPALVSVGWYRGWHDEATLADPRAELRAGQRWRFTLRMKQPHGTFNPGGFDVELWLFEQGLRATAYVRAASDATGAQRREDAAGYPVERLRQHVKDAIVAHVGDTRAAGVLAALAVGDQAAIEREDWELFRASGIAHLVSISGLHVTMFAWLVGAIVGRVWRCSARLALLVPTPWAARWGGLFGAAGYAMLAGWGVPAQRTVWMIASAALLATLGVRWPWLLVLLMAAVVVTVIDPWALLQPGFWLSFAAVGLLMSSSAVFHPGSATSSSRGWRARLAATAREGLRTQLIATLGLAPLTLVFFQQLSVVGFAANLVAIPLVTLVVTPLALLGVLMPPLWHAGAVMVQALCVYLDGLTSLPWSVWTVPAAPWWAQALGLLGGALLVMPLPMRLRLLALPLALPLLWPAVPRPAEGRFELVAVDVGQGTAVLVRTREHLLLYDTGPQYSPESDAGQRVLLPLLRVRGERPLDLMMLSHRDTDHVGGAGALLKAWPVQEMSS